jgi:hypothetical protein
VAGGWRLGRKVGDGDEERRRKVEVGRKCYDAWV